MHAHPFGKIKVNNASADQQVERERGVFFFNFVSLFYSGNSSTYFKVSCRTLQKILIVQDVQRLQFLGDCITILTGSRSQHMRRWRASESWFSEGSP